MSAAPAEFLDGPEVEILGWVLFHSMWIDAAIAAGLFMLLLALRRRSANLRYWLSFVSLGLMVAVPVVVLGYLCHTAWFHADTAALRQLSDVLQRATLALRAAPPDVAAAGSAAPSLPEFIPVQRGVESFLLSLQPYLKWVCALWAGLLGATMIRQIVGWLLLRRLLSQQSVPVRSRSRRLRRLARQLGVPRVQFRRTSVLTEPAAAGWRPEVVLLPARLLSRLNSRQLDAVVAHELAHVRRRDYVANMVQVVMETLVLYHPAAWWVSARIRQERENCCDDIAAAAVGSRLAYARALADAVDEMSRTPPMALPMGGGVLLPRILRLVADPRERTSHAASGLAASVLLAVVVLLLGSHLFASTAALREARAWQQDRPFNHAIYEVLELPIGSAFLPALAHAVQAKAHLQPDGPAMQQLVTALNVSSSPLALSDAALPRMDDLWFGASHMNRPDWPYGNSVDHLALARSMWDHALALQSISPLTSRDYARAAMLLEIQGSYRIGIARLNWRLSRPGAQHLLGLSDEQFQRLWAHQRTYQRTFEAYSAYLAGPLYELTVMDSTKPPPGRQSIVEAVALLEQMSVLASNRPDIQFRLATHLWRLRASPAATPDLLRPLKQTMLANVHGYGADHFRRWIDLALTTPPLETSTMVRKYTQEDARQKFWVAEK